jgi:glycosyl transferase family 2
MSGLSSAASCRPRLHPPCLGADDNMKESPSQSHLAESCGVVHPPVTVLLCAREVSEALLGTLNSLQLQMCARSEIVVVINSADCGMDMRLRELPVHVFFEPRRGVNNARNRGLAEAKGELIICLDDDVLVQPGWVHAMAAAFMEHAADCVTGIVEPLGYGVPVSRFVNERTLAEWVLDGGSCEWLQNVLCHGMGFGCNMGFSRHCLETLGGFPGGLGAGGVLPAADENYMFFRVLSAGMRLAHTPRARVSHVSHSLSRERAMQYSSAALAYALKLFAEEPQYRWKVARAAWAHRPKVRAHGDENFGQLLSLGDKLKAYACGVRSFLQHRKQRSS